MLGQLSNIIISISQKSGFSAWSKGIGFNTLPIGRLEGLDSSGKVATEPICKPLTSKDRIRIR